MAALLAGLGIGRVDRGESVFAVGVTQIQAREVLQVGLGDDGFLAILEFDQQRQKGQSVIFHLAQWRDGIGVFKRIVKLLFDEVAIAFAGVDIRHPCRVILIKIKFDEFANHLERLFEIGLKAIGNAFVIGAENHLIIPFKTECQFVILVLNFSSLVKRGFDSLIYGLSLGRNDGWF